MGTNEDKTREEISAACGKMKTKSVSYSEGKDMSVSTSAQSVPLIYPSELKNLNDPENGVIGNAVVTISGLYPIRGKTTPYFKAMDLYKIEELKDEDKRDFMIFDENKNRYDIARTVAFLKSMQSLADLPDGATAVANIEERAVAAEIQNVVAQQILLRVKKEIQSLQGRISVEDFARLSVATTVQKAAILDELAEKATAKGDMFLAAALDKIRSYLLHDADELAAYEAAAESKARG